MNPLLAALVAAGVITQDEAERINRQQDPDAARLWAEQQLAAATQGGLSAQQARLADLLRTTGGNPSAAALDAFWAAEDARLWESMRPALEQVAAENAVGMAVRLGGPDMWRTVNEAMISWVDAYYVNADAAAVGSIPNLNLTSRTQFAQTFVQWQRGELEIGTTQQGLGQLVEALTPTFGPARASTIAVTETTRVLQASAEAAAMENEFISVAEWLTVAGEGVCPICGPMHGLRRNKGERVYRHPTLGQIAPPPAHPRCRCAENWMTQPVAELPRPPEERYQWSEEAYRESQRNQRAAQRQPNAVRTLTGG